MKFKPSDFTFGDGDFSVAIAKQANARFQEWLNTQSSVGGNDDGVWYESWEIPPDTHFAKLIRIEKTKGSSDE